MLDRQKIKVKPLKERINNLDLSSIRPLEPIPEQQLNSAWRQIAARIVKAKSNGAAVILMAGGHVFRSGVQNYIIDLMTRGYISCLATNGAGMIHDYEFSLIGATTESVAKYITEGQFGLWQETGEINNIINRSFKADKLAGMGQVIGRAIEEGSHPHKKISLFAAGYRLGIPITVHVGLGYDIIHEHPNCDGAATGALSYNDFLRFAAMVQKIKGGMVMDFGSAVMAPEVFLKALSMARNIAHQNSQKIDDFTALVCDIRELPADYKKEPDRSAQDYYFRPWKTMLVRTTSTGGESVYIKGRHAETIPSLWTAINQAEKSG